MSRWKEEFENHQIHETLKEVRRFLKNASSEDIDDNHKTERSRMRKVLLALKASVENMDTDISPLSPLDNLNNQLHRTGFFDYMESYSSAGDVEDLKNANNIFTRDISIGSIASSAVFPPKNEKSMEIEYDRFHIEVSNKENEIKTIFEETNQKFSEIGSLVEKKTETINRYHDELKEEMKRVYSEAEEKIEEIRKFHGIVVTSSMAGGFKVAADWEQKNANRWRRFSMGFYLSILGWAVFITILSVNVSLEVFGDVKNFEILDGWSLFIKIASFSVPAFIAAQFAIRQSTMHRKNEYRMRQLYLETEAFNPFIAELAPETQEVLIEEFARHIFGQHHNIDEKFKSSWIQKKISKSIDKWSNPDVA